MTAHYTIATWAIDGPPSGARRRLEGLLSHIAPRLESDERLTVLHGSGANRLDLGRSVAWRQFGVPPAPTWRRAIEERRRLASILSSVGASMVELGTLPVPNGLPCPVSLTIHDVRDLDGWRRRLPRWLARSVVRRSIRRAACVIVPSEFTAARLRAHDCEPSRTHVIPGGIDERQIRSGPRSEPAYVLHVGHLEPRKNLGLLLAAVAQAHTRPELRLVGKDRGSGAVLRSRARSTGIEDRVHVHGDVDDDELARLYAGAAVVAIPSLYEGFGFPVLEGLAADRPTLISDRGALPEVAAGAAILAPGNDPSAWSRAIDTAIRSPASHPARHARARELDWDRAARATLSVWRDLVHGVRASNRAD